jgi:hypothetical protein
MDRRNLVVRNLVVQDLVVNEFTSIWSNNPREATGTEIDGGAL